MIAQLAGHATQHELDGLDHEKRSRKHLIDSSQSLLYLSRVAPWIILGMVVSMVKRTLSQHTTLRSYILSHVDLDSSFGTVSEPMFLSHVLGPWSLIGVP